MRRSSQTLYLVGTPALLTSLTTAAGFASMSFVPIKSIAHMGIYSAVGVIAAFVLSLTLLMAFLSFGRATPRPAAVARSLKSRAGKGLQPLLFATANTAIRHRRAIMWVSAGIFVFSAVGITQIRVDSNWLDDFRDETPLKLITERVDTVMGGVTNFI